MLVLTCSYVNFFKKTEDYKMPKKIACSDQIKFKKISEIQTVYVIIVHSISS